MRDHIQNYSTLSGQTVYLSRNYPERMLSVPNYEIDEYSHYSKQSKNQFIKNHRTKRKGRADDTAASTKLNLGGAEVWISLLSDTFKDSDLHFFARLANGRHLFIALINWKEIKNTILTFVTSKTFL